LYAAGKFASTDSSDMSLLHGYALFRSCRQQDPLEKRSSAEFLTSDTPCPHETAGSEKFNKRPVIANAENYYRKKIIEKQPEM